MPRAFRNHAQRELKLANHLEKIGAILHGEKIPDDLKGHELKSSHNGYGEQELRGLGIPTKEYEGHFLLASGVFHTDRFFDIQLAMRSKQFTDDLGILMKVRLEEKGFITSKGPIFNAIIGPARGAIPVGATLLQALGNPSNIIELYPAKGLDGVFSCRYPFPDPREIMALWDDDVFTTGVSLRQTMEACHRAAEVKTLDLLKRKRGGGKESQPAFYFIGGLVAVNRAPDLTAFLRNTITFPIGYCLRLEAQTWPANQCPLCEVGIPLYRP